MEEGKESIQAHEQTQLLADGDMLGGPTSAPKPKRTWLQLLLLSSVLISIQFTYAVEFAMGTPFFKNKCNVSDSMISIVWLAGPVSGGIVQPVVGIFSDRLQGKWGRRRPFLVGGGAVLLVGMLLFALAEPIGKQIDATSTTPMLIIAITALWLLNASINVMQGPARSLIADIVADEQQNLANSLLSGLLGLASIISGVLVKFLPDEIPFFGSELTFLFFIGMCVVVVCTIPTLVLGKEERYVPDPSEKQVGAFKGLYLAFRHMPGPLLRVGIVFFFSWMAFSPVQYYITDWFGEVVYGASSDAVKHPEQQAAYQAGVKEGALGNTLLAAVCLVWSLVQSKVGEKIGTKWVYFLTQLIATVVYVLPMWFPGYPPTIGFPTTSALAIGLMFVALSGMNFTTFNSVPYAVAAQCVPKKNIGLMMGVLNAFCVVAQQISNTLASLTISWFSPAGTSNPSYGLLAGGVFSAFACLAALTIKEPKNEYQPIEQGEEHSLVDSVSGGDKLGAEVASA